MVDSHSESVWIVKFFHLACQFLRLVDVWSFSLVNRGFRWSLCFFGRLPLQWAFTTNSWIFSSLVWGYCYSFGLIGLNLSLVFQLAFFQFSLQVFVVAHSKSESLSTLAFLCSLSCLQYHSPSCVNDQSFVPFFVSIVNWSVLAVISLDLNVTCF